MISPSCLLEAHRAAEALLLRRRCRKAAVAEVRFQQVTGQLGEHAVHGSKGKLHDLALATRQPKTRNALALNFHEFIAMWKDVLEPGALHQRLKHLWDPPEYVRPEAAAKAVPASKSCGTF